MAGKYYVVWEGAAPGVYASWPECQAQVNGVVGAKYKSYPSREEADKAYREGWKKHWGLGKTSGDAGAGAKRGASAAAGSASKTGGSGSTVRSKGARVSSRSRSAESSSQEIDYDSISVDVGTRGNPGPVEYKGVDTQTGDVLFSCGPVRRGTNNLGEFLAIVHALAYLKKQGSAKTVYSDSRTALKWVREKQVVTTLARDESTKEIWELVDRALHWLRTNAYPNKVLKWQTEEWGEIKADYGRK